MLLSLFSQSWHLSALQHIIYFFVAFLAKKTNIFFIFPFGALVSDVVRNGSYQSFAFLYVWFHTFRKEETAK